MEELIQRLLEYRQLKEATRMLDRRSQARDLLHQSRPAVTDAGIPLEEVGLYHLVDAFRKILFDSGFDKGPQQTIVGDRPLAEYIGDLLKLLRGSPVVSFLALFRNDTSRIDLIGHFLAVLELMRARIIKAVQETAFGEILIEAIGELPAKWEPAADLWSTQAPKGEELEELKARQMAEEEADAQEAKSANDAELARPDDAAAPGPSGDDLPPAGQAASA